MAAGGKKKSNGRNGGNQPAPHTQLRTLGRYTIEKKVGSGGMGVVYRATDSKLKRKIALKVLPKDKAKNETLVARFQSEAEAAAHLRHENIIGVYDSGELEGYLFIAMEFVDGIDVQELMLRGDISPKRSLDIIRQTTLALQHAFEQNIVHRDIKPSNLMITRDGMVKLADMGLARSLNEEESSNITRAGTTVGTVDYMSPEQARDSKSADFRSDIYSLGATWFHMLCARPPFSHGDLLNKIHAHASEEPPDPRDINADIPDAIAEMIFRMLEKKPEDRYQNPTEVLDAIKHANLKKRELSSDLLSSLAAEETSDEIPARKTKKKRPRSSKPSIERTNDSDAPAVDLMASLLDEDEEPPRQKTRGEGGKGRGERAERGTKTKRRKSASQEQAGSGKPTRRKPGRSTDDTKADRRTTESSVPSARDVMLSRGYRQGKRGGVSFDKSKIIAIFAVIIGVCVVGSIASSKFRGGGADAAPAPVNPGDTPAGAPSTDPGPDAPAAPSPPPRGASPPRRSR